jgi:signal transduction histidine kinase
VDNVGTTIDDVRRLCRQLIPCMLEEVDLQAALENLVNEFERLYDEEVSLHMDGNFQRMFDLEAQTAIYRIFQEALNNIVKHADATRVDITVHQDGKLVSFAVEDNGTGI